MNRLKKVKEALEFYANESSLLHGGDIDIPDRGEKAKGALAELKEYRERLESKELLENVEAAITEVYDVHAEHYDVGDREAAQAAINVIRGDSDERM